MDTDDIRFVFEGDDEPFTLTEFLHANSAPGSCPLDIDELRSVLMLTAGESARLAIGGGYMTLTRVDPMDAILFRKLDAEEEAAFRAWTRSFWSPKRPDGFEVYHPVVRDEWRKIDAEVYAPIAVANATGD